MKEFFDKYNSDRMQEIREIRQRRKQNLKYLKELNLEMLRQRHLKKLTILHSNDLHGDVLADGMKEQLGVDLALIGSGSIRGEALGPIVTLQDFLEVFPYQNAMIGFHMTGAQLRQATGYLMRDEAIFDTAHCEFFQVSKGFFCEYDVGSHRILQLKMNGEDVKDDDVFFVTAEKYYYGCIEQSLGIPVEEIEKNGQAVQLAGEAANVLEEYLSRQEFVKLDEEPRLVIHI